MKINESLFAGDLISLVSDKISINEYNAKIDPNAMVLAFFVKEEDPAYDLSRFIEFGPIKDVLDTEVSPAPDENGNYLVFVEIVNKDKNSVAKSIKGILRTVKYLTDIDTWTYTIQNKTGKIVV